ncbi:DUF222 domain-containing protein, partial [Isoptericola sp. NPDC057559]|uniref:HNH endonuclease signature motif containing protein n=1 Tax=Isoptericola sp. NPDC057559 TaxID=3346168 RepID=UPI0036B8A4ED
RAPLVTAVRATVLERELAGLVAGRVATDGRAEVVGAGSVDAGSLRLRWALSGAALDVDRDEVDRDEPGTDRAGRDGRGPGGPRHGGPRDAVPAAVRSGDRPDGRGDVGHGPERPAADDEAVPGSRPLLAALDDLAPGPELAALLASVDAADLDDFTILEVLAAWERVASWAQAGSARVLAEMLERTRGSSRHEFVADAVAARLGTTRHGAAQLVAVAHGTSRLPEVADALAAGVVDRRKAEALVDAGRLLDHRRREAVAAVLPDVERLTVPQIRARMRRAEVATDPSGADERRRAARAERFVRLEPVDDAMAYLTAYLPADDAARAFAEVDDVALAMRRAPGETRRLAECRADALVGLVTGAVGAGRGGADEDAGAGSRAGAAPGAVSRARGRGTVRVSVAASTLLGSDDLPAILAGHGPIPASMARALAADPDAVWQRLFTDAGSGVLTDVSSRSYRPSEALRAAVVARDVTCTFPGCQVPAASSDLDHVDPYDPAVGGPQTHGANLHALCRTHHRAKTVGGWDVSRDPASGATTWTAPTGHRFERDPVPQDPRHDPDHWSDGHQGQHPDRRRRPRGRKDVRTNGRADGQTNGLGRDGPPPY